MGVGRHAGLHACVYLLCMCVSMPLTASTWGSEDKLECSLLPCGPGRKPRVPGLVKGAFTTALSYWLLDDFISGLLTCADGVCTLSWLAWPLGRDLWCN